MLAHEQATAAAPPVSNLANLKLAPGFAHNMQHATGPATGFAACPGTGSAIVPMKININHMPPTSSSLQQQMEQVQQQILQLQHQMQQEQQQHQQQMLAHEQATAAAAPVQLTGPAQPCCPVQPQHVQLAVAASSGVPSPVGSW